MPEITKELIAQVVKSLRSNGFAPVEFVETAAEATRLALDLIPLKAKVGYGGSTTIGQIGLLPRLKTRGTTVLNLVMAGLPYYEADRQIARSCDLFLASSNAVTLDGKLVNIDGTGNRVAGMAFGPESVILIIGVNKIVRDVDEALDRIKNVIAPYNALVRHKKVPCAVTLRCTDCKSPDRQCRVTMIIEKRPRHTKIAILLVGEDLGLGWDPAWPRERIEKMVSVHRQVPHDRSIIME